MNETLFQGKKKPARKQPKVKTPVKPKKAKRPPATVLTPGY